MLALLPLTAEGIFLQRVFLNERSISTLPPILMGKLDLSIIVFHCYTFVIPTLQQTDTLKLTSSMAFHCFEEFQTSIHWHKRLIKTQVLYPFSHLLGDAEICRNHVQ